MLTPQTATRTHGDYAVTKYATPDGYRYVVFHLAERLAVADVREATQPCRCDPLEVQDDA